MQGGSGKPLSTLLRAVLSVAARLRAQAVPQNWLGIVSIASIACCVPLIAYAAAALPVTTLAKPPTIDGIIDETEWAGARTTDQSFIQTEPAYGEPSPF